MTKKLDKVARRVALAAVILAGAWVVRRAARSRRRRATARRALSLRPGPVTQSLVTVNPADTHMGVPSRDQEQRLDEALQETFPGSDPISTGIE